MYNTTYICAIGRRTLKLTKIKTYSFDITQPFFFMFGSLCVVCFTIFSCYVSACAVYPPRLQSQFSFSFKFACTVLSHTVVVSLFCSLYERSGSQYAQPVKWDMNWYWFIIPKTAKSYFCSIHKHNISFDRVPLRIHYKHTSTYTHSHTLSSYSYLMERKSSTHLSPQSCCCSC